MAHTQWQVSPPLGPRRQRKGPAVKSETHSVGDVSFRAALQLRQAYANEQRAGVGLQHASGKVGGKGTTRFNSGRSNVDPSSDPTSATCVGKRRTVTNKFLSGARASMRPVRPYHYTASITTAVQASRSLTHVQGTATTLYSRQKPAKFHCFSAGYWHGVGNQSSLNPSI